MPTNNSQSGKSRGCILFLSLAIISTIVCLCMVAAVWGLAVATNDISLSTAEIKAGSLTEQIAVIDIEGEILGGAATDIFGNKLPDPVAQIIDQLNKSTDDDKIKGVILRLNTPGGTVYDSFNLADAVRKFRDVSQKPVVALIETSAASGGYLIASQADYIVANQTSVVGSIGVIVNIQDTDGLLEKLGINNIVITSDGAEQKAGKNLSDPNSADYKNTKQLLNDYQLLFNDYVARGRNLTAEQVKRLADGSIVAGKRALDNKLVDELGNMDSAVAQVKVLAGIEGEPRIFNYAQIEVGNNNLFGIINKLFGAKVSNRNVWFASIPY